MAVPKRCGDEERLHAYEISGGLLPNRGARKCRANRVMKFGVEQWLAVFGNENLAE